VIKKYKQGVFMSRAFEVLSYYASSQITLPKRQTMYSAGYDLASAEKIVIPPKTIAFIKTGLKVRLGKDEVLLVYARSSLAIKKQLMMSNGVGVIDADYYNNPQNEGHIMVPLYNMSDQDVMIDVNERIAQGIFQTYLKVDEDEPIESLRQGGFGSSSI
jgi:dUTP pyrophosphatase